MKSQFPTAKFRQTRNKLIWSSVCGYSTKTAPEKVVFMVVAVRFGRGNSISFSASIGRGVWFREGSSTRKVGTQQGLTSFPIELWPQIVSMKLMTASFSFCVETARSGFWWTSVSLCLSWNCKFSQPFLRTMLDEEEWTRNILKQNKVLLSEGNVFF